jgi:hypothetical protein
MNNYRKITKNSPIRIIQPYNIQNHHKIIQPTIKNNSMTKLKKLNLKTKLYPTKINNYKRNY